MRDTARPVTCDSVTLLVGVAPGEGFKPWLVHCSKTQFGGTDQKGRDFRVNKQGRQRPGAQHVAAAGRSSGCLPLELHDSHWR